MQRTVLFLIFISACVAAEELGVQSKISDGSAASIEKVPYHVSIRRLLHLAEVETHHCGGSIISTEWVLTAGHCGQYFEARDLKIYHGSADIIDGGSRRNVIENVVHPRFYANSGIPHWDVTVMKVDSPFVYSPRVQPVKLVAPNQFAVNDTKGIVTGWGYYETQSGYPVTLQQVSLSVTSTTECNKVYTGLVDDSMICALGENSEGTCFGDSGGPFVANGVQIGIVSWGRYCGDGNPNVFVNVSYFRDWITEHTGI